MKYTIHVTEEHIAKGILGDCVRCPVALAVREQTPWKNAVVTSAWVYPDQVASWVGEGGVEIPSVSSDFIDRFDDSIKQLPITFELELPEAAS